jgi:hypothetical protein
MGTTNDEGLCASALVANSAPVAVAASFLLKMFTKVSPVEFAEPN